MIFLSIKSNHKYIGRLITCAMPRSQKKLTLREHFEYLRKQIKKNNGKIGKTNKPKSSYTFTGQDANGLDGSHYLKH